MPRKQGDAVDGLVLDAAERIAADDCAPADVDGVDRERLLASDQPEPRLDPEETTNVRRVAGDRDRLQPAEYGAVWRPRRRMTSAFSTNGRP